MPSLPVVKHLDVVEQALPSFVEGTVLLVTYMLGFQGMEETLHRCVVMAITLTAHARLDIVLEKRGRKKGDRFIFRKKGERFIFRLGWFGLNK